MGRFLALVIISAITFATLPLDFVRAEYTAPHEAARQDKERDAQLRRVFRNYRELRLDARRVLAQVRSRGRLSLVTSDRTLQLRLVPNDLRAPNYRAVRIEAGGRSEVLQTTPVVTYRGALEGEPRTDARFTIDGQHVEGLILTESERFYLEPLKRYDQSAQEDEYILYKASDIKSEAGDDASANATMNHRVNRAFSSLSSAMPQASTTLREVELATEADYEFVQKAGGTAEAANTMIQSIVNQVDAIYRREVGLTFKIVFQSAWNTSADPYNATDLVGIITEFRDYWNINRTNVPRDLAHMWTGKETNNRGVSYGGTVGYTDGTVCRQPSLSYGVSPYVVQDALNVPQRTALTAHEIGHSFSATHVDNDPSCANTIMNSLASPSTQLTFCQLSRDQITTYVNNNSSCLAVVAATPGPATVALSATSYTVNESDPAGVVNITVNRSGDTSTAFTVDYLTSDVSGLTPCQTNTNGVASERCDYATAAGTLRFAAGETAKTIQIPIINDAYVEPAETFTITLRNAQGVGLGTASTANVTILSDDTQPATVNPIDNQAFFIRQQYIDFLGRQPEQAGFDFWMNRMNNCPAGQICDRIDTSQRFFQSDEFQERGFYVYRLYDAILGRLPRYSEFVLDVARLNGFQTVAEQRASKDAYLLEFANRQEFKTLYGQYLMPDASRAVDPVGFVDALIARAGVTPSNRQTLINNLQTGARTPWQTLEDFILQPELSAVGTKFYDRGFITMQYFGYLRRDPDQAGFDFWVSQLIGPNAPHRGDYRFMVRGFLQSDEYRFRFALISGGP